MAKLVTIINPNGRKGRVAASYPPLVAGDLRVAPSERDRIPTVEATPDDGPIDSVITDGVVHQLDIPADDPSIVVDPTAVPVLPPANATTAVWQAHASSAAGREFATSRDLDPNEVATRSRDALVALFTSKE